MLFDNDSDKLNNKQQIDKTTISAWLTFLNDVWGNRIDIIKRKLIYNIQDRYIWDNKIENCVDEMILKLSKY
jgi:hypothetical protein